MTALLRVAPPALEVCVSSYDLVVVGGVPGAGKTTAIARATSGLDGVRPVDPEHVSGWLRNRLPARLPYRAYRWLVHLLHTLRVLAYLVLGPSGGRRLVVHDPGTRPGRRSLFLGLARLAGWRIALVYIDVERAAAQDGQRRRGRIVRSFDHHWASWQRLRPALARDSARGWDEPVVLVSREAAAGVLRGLAGAVHAEPVR